MLVNNRKLSASNIVYNIISDSLSAYDVFYKNVIIRP